MWRPTDKHVGEEIARAHPDLWVHWGEFASNPAYKNIQKMLVAGITDDKKTAFLLRLHMDIQLSRWVIMPVIVTMTSMASFWRGTGSGSALEQMWELIPDIARSDELYYWRWDYPLWMPTSQMVRVMHEHGFSLDVGLSDDANTIIYSRGHTLLPTAEVEKSRAQCIMKNTWSAYGLEKKMFSVSIANLQEMNGVTTHEEMWSFNSEGKGTKTSAIGGPMPSTVSVRMSVAPDTLLAHNHPWACIMSKGTDEGMAYNLMPSAQDLATMIMWIMSSTSDLIPVSLVVSPLTGVYSVELTPYTLHAIRGSRRCSGVYSAEEYANNTGALEKAISNAVKGHGQLLSGTAEYPSKEDTGYEREPDDQTQKAMREALGKYLDELPEAYLSCKSALIDAQTKNLPHVSAMMALLGSVSGNEIYRAGSDEFKGGCYGKIMKDIGPNVVIRLWLYKWSDIADRRGEVLTIPYLAPLAPASAT